MKLSDGGSSPLLVAHPGSPVDIPYRRRRSRAISFAPTHSYTSHADFMDDESYPPTDRIETGRGTGSVAVNRDSSMMDDIVMDDEQFPNPPTSMQTFFLPESSSDVEQNSITNPPVPVQDGSEVTAMDTSWIDFDFGFDTTPQMATTTFGSSLKSSIAITSTSGRFSRGALTIDTSVADSLTTMASSETSMSSAVSNTTDIYGWEEELDRRTSSDNRLTGPAVGRRVSGGSAMMLPHFGGDLHSIPNNHVDVKRKSLWHRVLNLGRGLDELSAPASPTERWTPSA